MQLTEDQRGDIEQLRASSSSTLRPTVPALEEILYHPTPVLDHGFVRVIDYMGDDAAIVQAARVSYGRGTKQTNDDAGLINYLMRHWHTSPFEMCEIKLHVKLPIFVARDWIRHRTANVSEYSGRYSVLDKEFYMPSPELVGKQSTSHKQGRGEALPPEQAAKVLDLLREDADRNYRDYMWLLNTNEETGEVADPGRIALARELARMNLTLNIYTQWYWKIDLHNLMHFLRLRTSPRAQYEIQAYANKIFDIMQAWVPITAAAFAEHRLGAASFSASGLGCLKRMLNGEAVTQETSGMTKGEWREFNEQLELGGANAKSGKAA